MSLDIPLYGATSDAMLHKIVETLNSINKRKYDLAYPDIEIRLVTGEQMLYYAALNGLPQFYTHWSIGKTLNNLLHANKRKLRSIPLEMIINTDPAICYIDSSNSPVSNLSVLAHAMVGHGSFFTSNYLFTTWTDPTTILEKVNRLTRLTDECTKRYGSQTVMGLLDAAHSLMPHSFDSTIHSREKRKAFRQQNPGAREILESLRELKGFRTSPTYKLKARARLRELRTVGRPPGHTFPWNFPEENILHFIAKTSFTLRDWERQILLLITDINQYFLPQICTKLMNEGWATFWAYEFLQTLHQEGHITDVVMIEALKDHTDLIGNGLGPFYDRYAWRASRPILGGQYILNINPYALGYKIWKKIKQVCENPTAQDWKEVPLICARDWLQVVKEVMIDYNDATFVQQFLTSDVAHEFQMMVIKLLSEKDNVAVKEEDLDPFTRAFLTFDLELHKPWGQVLATDDPTELQILRNSLADHYRQKDARPHIEVSGVDLNADNTLQLHYLPHKNMELDRESVKQVLKYVKRLWGPYPVSLAYSTTDKELIVHQRNYE